MKKRLFSLLLVSALVVVAGAVLGTLGMVDYYGAGVLTVFIFYFFHGHGRKWWCLLGQLAALYWVNVELLGGLMYPIQLFGMDFELCQQGFALLALVPMPTVLFLAVPYIFFSVVWVIKPNRVRSIVAFAVFAAVACTYYTVTGLRSVGMGCGLIAGVAIVRHLDREKFRRVKESAAE